MITIARYFEPSEAHVVRALLASAGFAAVVADEHLVTANYPLSTALGGVRILVPAGQAEAAGELVAAYARGDLERELERETGTPREACPACGAPDPRGRVPVGTKLLAVAMVAFVGPITFPARDSIRTCTACGHTWSSDDLAGH